MPKPVFRGNQSPDTKEPQIIWRGRDNCRTVEEQRKIADTKNMRNNYQSVENTRNT